MPAPAYDHRWMRDDAVGLLLQESDGNWPLLQSCPNPAMARAWLASLTLFRFSDALKRSLYDSLQQHRSIQGWGMTTAWMVNLAYAAADDPESYPFCLSEREFDHYARTNFGDTVPNSEGIYHPPSFYYALVEDVGAGLGTASVGIAIALALPAVSTAAAVGVEVSSRMATAVAGDVAGATAAHFLPGGAWDAAKKDRMWRVYELEYQRRSLA